MTTSTMTINSTTIIKRVKPWNYNNEHQHSHHSNDTAESDFAVSFTPRSFVNIRLVMQNQNGIAKYVNLFVRTQETIKNRVQKFRDTLPFIFVMLTKHWLSGVNDTAKFLKIQISRRNKNQIRKYFNLFVKGIRWDRIIMAFSTELYTIFSMVVLKNIY